MVAMSTIEMRVPKKMTAPIGDHNVLFSIIIGNTPTEAAAEVRKIGRIRRSPAWKAASLTERPMSRRSYSA